MKSGRQDSNLRPISTNASNSNDSGKGGAQSGALPPELAEVNAAWSKLSPAVRAVLLAMVRTS
jgi:hypothetical protein